MQAIKGNTEYTVNIEFCGEWHKKPVKGLEQGQMYVTRCCGEWCGKSLTLAGAIDRAIMHNNDKR